MSKIKAFGSLLLRSLRGLPPPPSFSLELLKLIVFLFDQILALQVDLRLKHRLISVLVLEELQAAVFEELFEQVGRFLPREHSLRIDVVLRLRVAEPWVSQDLVGATCAAESALGILVQKAVDDVLELVGMGDADLVGDFYLGARDLLVLASWVPVVKWEYACEQLVHDGANSPPVGRKAVALTLEKLWGEVSWCSCHFVGDLVVP